MKLNELNKITSALTGTAQMPVLFIGHGSPMNAIEDNEFVSGWKSVAAWLPKPKAILCVSAHWETRGTFFTAMEWPATIHDFGGFPQALFDVHYPAPGSPLLARETIEIIKKTEVSPDEKWGLDHGAWSVIRRLFPDADVPVIELSLDYYQPPKYHYELASELAALRKKGVLIIGSGNMIHNLGMVAWDRLNAEEYAYDWAAEAGERMKEFILNGDHQQLIDYRSQGKAFGLAIPTPEHYLPLLYALALKEENEEVSFFNDKTIAGSISMASLKIGNT